MNAIELLEEQHDDVEDLFEQLEEADDDEDKKSFFAQIADALAIHATIEEQIFYPAVKARRTKDILLESLEEHLGIKRVIADLLDLDPSDETFDAKMQVLQEEVEHHVEEERTKLFPPVKKLLAAADLDRLGQEMESLVAELEGTEPRFSVRDDTGKAAPLS